MPSHKLGPAGFNRSQWHLQESSWASHLISPQLLFPKQAFSLPRECIQETGTINTDGNVNISILGVAIEAHLQGSIKVSGFN